MNDVNVYFNKLIDKEGRGFPLKEHIIYISASKASHIPPSFCSLPPPPSCDCQISTSRGFTGFVHSPEDEETQDVAGMEIPSFSDSCAHAQG